MNRHEPQVENYVKPDRWYMGASLEAADGFKDDSFPGCQFRLPVVGNMKLAVNVTVTGKPHWVWGSLNATWRSRCKIEFVGDGEPSKFSGGWIFHGV